MARLRPVSLLPLAAFAALAVVFGVYLWQVGVGGKVISDLPSALIDRPVPEFTLPPIAGDGEGLTSAALEGQVSLVNVWASWCPPCRVEHPVLMHMAAAGIPIYGINYRDRPEDAEAFLQELGNPYRAIGADRTGRVAIDWGVYGYPETFVIDAEGRVRYRHVGPIMPHDLENRIMPLLRSLNE
jgi:cytochrome c biogenesis protein CcmG, thiol:disulfide interchange protein DsbE